MNRLRHAYLQIAPGVEPCFTTGHHDDERGLAAGYLLTGQASAAVVWAALFARQRWVLNPLRRTTPRFPTPPDQS